MKKPFLFMLLATALASMAAARPVSTVLAFETEGLDLETDAVVALDGDPSPSALSTEAHQAITRYFERDLYRVRRAADDGPAGSALEGANPAQAYTTLFTPQGILLRPRDVGADLGLALTGWGHGTDLPPVALVPPRAQGQRVEYVRGALTEWYVNRSSGLEQGFTLNSPPQEARGEERLRLEMTLSGPLVAEVTGGSIVLRDASGTARLRYGGLQAWDATGRVLAAEMTLAENRLTLEVDDAGALYPVTVDPTIVNESAKLLASDGVASDNLGFSAAVSGSTVVVGARGDSDNGSGSGSAYVFVKPAGGWSGTLTESAKLLASDGTAGNQFGSSIAVSGSTVVVGAQADNDNGPLSGSAYVFEEPAGGWSGTAYESAKLLASDGAPLDRLGWSIALSGSTVVAGANALGAAVDSGSAYVFEEPAGGWSGTLNEDAKLLASDAAPGDYLGWSVAVSGSTVVVGARDDDDNGSNSGSAYVFVEPAGGWSGTLNEDAKLLASDGALGDFFGYSAAASGSTLVVGSRGENAAYVFEEPAGGWSGTLNESAKLTGSDTVPGDEFGVRVGISGSTVVIGADLDDDTGSSSGSAYVFEEPAGGWTGTPAEDAKLLASDGAAVDLFGRAVGVSGSTIVVGAYRHADNGALSGAAYVFEQTPDSDDIRDLAALIRATPVLGNFTSGAYRVVMGYMVDAAARNSDLEDWRDVVTLLTRIVERTDGFIPPTDWMIPGAAKTGIHDTVVGLRDYFASLLP